MVDEDTFVDSSCGESSIITKQALGRLHDANDVPSCAVGDMISAQHGASPLSSMRSGRRRSGRGM